MKHSVYEQERVKLLLMVSLEFAEPVLKGFFADLSTHAAVTHVAA